MLLDPKDYDITDQAGTLRHYRLGKIPYLDGGREVCSQFFTTIRPCDYQLNEALSLKMFKHVSVVTDDGTEIQLKSKDLINNHVPDFTTGIQLEGAMLEHNAGFSVLGKIRKFQQQWSQGLPEWITKILTQLQAVSRQQAKPPTTNSERSIQ